MKKFLKQMAGFFNEESKNSLKYEQFKKDNELLVNSFNNTVHEQASSDPHVRDFTYKTLGSRVKNCYKKNCSFEISCPFFKDGEELGRANIVFVTSSPSKSIEKLYDNKTRILGIYFENGYIGGLYETKKGSVDYFYDKAVLEIVSLKDVTVELSLLKI
jgi:hypothetical protein